MSERRNKSRAWTRRQFLGYSFVGGAVALTAPFFPSVAAASKKTPLAPLSKGGMSGAETFIAKVDSYEADITSVILSGLKELGVTTKEIEGSRILLKPNLVETNLGAVHINTHPLVIRGAVEAFLHLGAARVLVAEGSGHSRDSLLVLEESGLAQVLFEDRIPFIDLNYDDIYTVPNLGGYASGLTTLTFPATLKQVDWIVSMPKLKTHHWVGVTLSMKNLFGVMPGIAYGWPKNVLHWAGIENSVVDINATLQPDFAIVDGIIGMEGDGPIMGTPRHVGAIVMGRNLPAVDATCSRIMGIDPYKVTYLATVESRLGPIDEAQIQQRGEKIASLQTNFLLLDNIPAQRGLRSNVS